MIVKEKGCEVYTFLQEKNTFTNKEGSNAYKIREGLHLDCNSENVAYLITCKKMQITVCMNCITRFHTGFNNYRSCHRKFYVGSCITRFCTHFNNYRCCYRKLCRGHFVIQVSFHAHFKLDDHCGIDNWKIILIGKRCNKQEARKKKLFWQYKLDTFVPHGLNERVLDL